MLRRQSLPPLIRHAFGVPPSPRGRLFLPRRNFSGKIKIKTHICPIKGGENKKREMLLEAKEEIHKSRTEAEKEIKERRTEVQKQERRLQQKEESLDKKLDQHEKKEDELARKMAAVQKQEEEVASLKRAGRWRCWKKSPA